MLCLREYSKACENTARLARPMNESPDIGSIWMWVPIGYTPCGLVLKFSLTPVPGSRDPKSHPISSSNPGFGPWHHSQSIPRLGRRCRQCRVLIPVDRRSPRSCNLSGLKFQGRRGKPCQPGHLLNPYITCLAVCSRGFTAYHFTQEKAKKQKSKNQNGKRKSEKKDTYLVG